MLLLNIFFLLLPSVFSPCFGRETYVGWAVLTRFLTDIFYLWKVGAGRLRCGRAAAR